MIHVFKFSSTPIPSISSPSLSSSSPSSSPSPPLSTSPPPTPTSTHLSAFFSLGYQRLSSMVNNASTPKICAAMASNTMLLLRRIHELEETVLLLRYSQIRRPLYHIPYIGYQQATAAWNTYRKLFRHYKVTFYKLRF